MNSLLPQLLAERLTRPLPGPMVGSRFESAPRPGRAYDQVPDDARHAAVLLVLYPHQEAWHLPMTLRPAHLPDHAGQVCLPGGALEPGEESSAAALREFREELGVEETPRLLGRLSTIYVHASHFRVDPWVAAAAARPEWQPNPIEVAQLLEVPLAHLLEPGSLCSHERQFKGQAYRAPHFDWQSCRIWGATCLILGELITVLEEMNVNA